MGSVLEKDMHTLLPSFTSGQIFFLFQKMCNVLKSMQKQFSYFLIFFSFNIFLWGSEIFRNASETLPSDTR